MRSEVLILLILVNFKLNCSKKSQKKKMKDNNWRNSGIVSEIVG